MTRRTFIATSAVPLSAQPLQWQELSPMPVPRAGLIAAAWRGQLLLAGGSDWQNDKKVLHQRTDIFDLKKNRWRSAADLPAPRCDSATAVTSDGVYALGGVIAGSIVNSVLRFDGTSWRELPEAALPSPAQYPIAVAEGGSIYVLGGLTRLADITTATTHFRHYRPGQGWRDLAPFPCRPRVTAGYCLHNRKLYLFGGCYQAEGKPLENLAEVWSYNFKSNTWSQHPNLPLARRAWSAVSSNKRVLLIGGYVDTFESAVFSCDPESGTLEPAGNLPHPLADVRFLKIGSRCINAGGETGFHIRGPWTLCAAL